MREVFKAFANLLDERFASEVYTTEDSVRYTFFYALLSNGICEHKDIVLERPHPTIKRAEMDTLILSGVSRPSIAIEFKYDRRNPGGTNQNRTQRAGAVFNDLFRLARVTESIALRRYFVYLTDAEMALYFQNPQNGLKDFFELPEGQLFTLDAALIAARAKTFREKVEKTQIECSVTGLFSTEVSDEHLLRVYKIKT